MLRILANLASAWHMWVCKPQSCTTSPWTPGVTPRPREEKGSSPLLWEKVSHHQYFLNLSCMMRIKSRQTSSVLLLLLNGLQTMGPSLPAPVLDITHSLLPTLCPFPTPCMPQPRSLPNFSIEGGIETQQGSLTPGHPTPIPVCKAITTLQGKKETAASQTRWACPQRASLKCFPGQRRCRCKAHNWESPCCSGRLEEGVQAWGGSGRKRVGK